MNIAGRAHYVLARVLLDLAPGPRIVRLILWNHIGKRKALCHCLKAMHVSRRRHVPARIPRVSIIVQFRAFSLRQPGICVKLIYPFYARSTQQHSAVDALSNEYRRPGLTAVQDGKGRKAQFAEPLAARNGRKPALWKELGTLDKVRLNQRSRRNFLRSHLVLLMARQPKLPEDRLDR